ncbi:MAG: biotin--[acetyl-CoA-carboxylase] ligase [Lachnospiraceae bacterium]|nr:biotin--[acetyl-CoA-carboxylase] ligase [Lachnospiraceae bacterium]
MLKEDILYELEARRGTPVSGQELADHFHVSRNAVWKVINSLKEEGYQISSARNRGYLLENSSDILSKEGILAELKGDCPQLEIRILEEVDSTNNEAKRMLASGFGGNALIAAKTQTMGRGRKGKSFYSPEGGGLYFSLILQEDEMTDQLSLLTIVTACAVLRALERKTGVSLQLKWVNDLFIGNKKAGGILSEAITDLESGKTEALVIGIGINLTTEAFPPELEQIATAVDTEVPRNALIAELVKELLSAPWQEPERELPFYREHSMVLGKTVLYQEERVLAETVDETGALLIRYENGEEKTIRGGSILLSEEF